MVNNELEKMRFWTLKQRAEQVLIGVLLGTLLTTGGCARRPYTTQVVQEDPRVLVAIQREVEPVNYTHPVKLSAQELKAILNGFSIREKKKLPLRWFAEEAPPHPLFREEEVNLLVPHLASALEKAGPNERVTFELRAPGFNPVNTKETTSGWIAIHEPMWHMTIDHFRVLVPRRETDEYYYRYPNMPPPPRDYLLNFEPGRFWVKDPATGDRVLDLRAFLKAPEAPLTP